MRKEDNSKCVNIETENNWIISFPKWKISNDKKLIDSNWKLINYISNNLSLFFTKMKKMT